MKNVERTDSINHGEIRKRRILVVDDHPIFRQGITQVINAESDLVVCADVPAGEDAIDALPMLKPDLIILDITLKTMSGIELVKIIKKKAPRLPVLVLSMHDESLYAERAMRAGASGYIMKQESAERVLGAIRKVLAGELYISPTMGSHMVRRFVNGRKDHSPLEKLSDRELEVLTLIGRGHGTREIAETLGLSIKTIESHRLHIKEKLEFRTAPEMVRFAVQWFNQARA